MKRRYRREPRNIADFRLTHRVKARPLAPALEKQILQRALDVVDGTNGRGYKIICPYTEAITTGDFLAGVFKVAAPGAKVIFLKMPVADLSGKKNSVKATQENLAKKISATDKKVVVVDYFFLGRTYNKICAALKGMGYKGEVDFKEMDPFYTPLENLDIGIRRNAGMIKSNDGKALLTHKNYIKYMNKHEGEVARLPLQISDAAVARQRRAAFNYGIAIAKAVGK
ncbi:MAG: hypothetical protein AABW59_05710 [archaeon]